jgi:hypothetical protein
MNSDKTWGGKMSEKRFTKDGLPIVSGHTAEVFARDLSRRLCEEGDNSGKSFCDEVAIRIKSENPDLAALYMDFRQGCLLHPRGPKVDTSTAYMLGFIMAYEGLRRQLEVNQMEQPNENTGYR